LLTDPLLRIRGGEDSLGLGFKRSVTGERRAFSIIDCKAF
jgi:ribosomal protein S6E (S10)